MNDEKKRDIQALPQAFIRRWGYTTADAMANQTQVIAETQEVRPDGQQVAVRWYVTPDHSGHLWIQWDTLYQYDDHPVYYATHSTEEEAIGDVLVSINDKDIAPKIMVPLVVTAQHPQYGPISLRRMIQETEDYALPVVVVQWAPDHRPPTLNPSMPPVWCYSTTLATFPTTWEELHTALTQGEWRWDLAQETRPYIMDEGA